MDGFRNINMINAAAFLDQRWDRSLRKRRLVIRQMNDPMNDMTERDFVKLYRLPQNIVRKFIDEIRIDLRPWERQSAVSAEVKVLTALRFFACGCYQRSVGQDFNVPVSQSVVSRSIHEVIAAVNNRLLNTYIKFPQTQEERSQVKSGFYRATGFPGVIGAVDGTHIAIVAPKNNEEMYINRKSYHSINVQGVCDYDMRILSINARYPGSTGDAFIWRNSMAKQELERRYSAGERNEWLLGDSGYGCEPWLLTPILGAQPGSPEEIYTRSHCRARCCVERCFGLLKARWRCLLKHRVLHYDPRTASQIINTCAVLHNIAINARLPPPPPLTAEEQEEELDAGDILPQAININNNFLGHSRQVRAQVVRRIWQHDHNH